MARKRSVTSAMGTDERIEQIAEKDQLSAMMWPWLLTAFDDWGRLDITSIGKIRLEIFPAFPKIKNSTITKAIDSYVSAGMVHRYQVGDRVYLAIRPTRWMKWQKYLQGSKRASAEAEIPAPTDAGWSEKEEDDMLIWLTKPNERSKLRQVGSVCGEIGTVGNVCGQSPLSVPSPSPSPLTLVASEEEECAGARGDGGAHLEDYPPPPKCYGEYSLRIRPLDLAASDLLDNCMAKGMTDEMLCDFLREANENGGKTLKYVRVGLENCYEQGIRTLDDYKGALARWRAKEAQDAKPEPVAMPTIDIDKAEEVLRRVRERNGKPGD